MKKFKKSIFSCVITFAMILATCVPAMAKVTYEKAPTVTVLKGSTVTVNATTKNWNSILNRYLNASSCIIEGDVGDSSMLRYAGSNLKITCPLYAKYKEKAKSGHFHTKITKYSLDKSKKVTGPVYLSAKLKALKTGTTYVDFKIDNRYNAGLSTSVSIIPGMEESSSTGKISDLNSTSISGSVKSEVWALSTTSEKTGSTSVVNDSKVIRVPVKIVQGVTSIKLNKTSATLSKGKSLTLKTTVAPSNAYNKKLSYSSSKTSVATVSSTGKIIAKAKGIAVITVKAQDGSGKTATCKITVK